ncbi:MAG: DUF4292 domain-containing protein [Filimonas sp.]|nr:DUF4292 domain-containing protein [Filimonas sp.]
MKQGIYLFLAFGLFLGTACKTTQKVQKIDNAISKKDTAVKVIVKKESVDSMSIVKDIVQGLEKKKIDFKTFNARVRVEYSDKDGSDQINATIQMQKDSAIWISLTGPLNIEGARLLVTMDSVKLYYRQKKTYQLRSIQYLSELTQIPFDFKTLQDLLIGNPIFLDNNIVSYKDAGSNLQVLMIGQLFKHLLTIEKGSQRVLHSKLDDVDPTRNRTCDITLSNYEQNGDIDFATHRKISVAEHSKLDVTLDFKKYVFNGPVNFPFTIPKNFKNK